MNMFSERMVAAIRLVTHTVEIAFFAYLVPYAYRYIMAAVDSQQVSPACGIPMYLIQSATLLSFCLAIIRLVQKWIQKFKVVIGKEELNKKGA